MQLCSCKHVRSIHTHCLITFATIYDTFIEIVILYAHGALSMGLCMHTYCTGTIHVCNVLSGTFIEFVNLYANSALINQLNLL